MSPEVEQRDREFHFTAADFERVRTLIYQRAGISLAPIKQEMVYGRLMRRVRALGYGSFAEYLAHLEAGDETEWETFVNSLTTNLTSFFRDAHHFEILLGRLRELKTRPLRIWCAAAATGEEPYSIAMTACEAFDSLTPPVSIVASDIDTHVLAIAEQGVYPIDRVEKLSANRLRRFFLKGRGAQAGYARVRPELQKLVRFTRINLLDARLPLRGPFDAIFCRNVMIYFDKPTQYGILKKFVPLLRPDGLLFSGPSENFLNAGDLFRPMGRTVYERADRPAPGPMAKA
ncbi:MAG: chemotaxis protein methyltransferase CheR [Rhodocyclaceae bacterium]|nr:MAG: chemotaxis protein methyltransferase CheR [Rhodocyclaceae bacterium]TND02818.1 MAG: chemotaxis protein methyltransferase CheR [Rhodocyclaceae bacterium]